MAYTPRKTGRGCKKAGAVLGAKQGTAKSKGASRAGRVLEECKRNRSAGIKIKLMEKPKPKKKIKLLPKPKPKKKIKLKKDGTKDKRFK